MSVGELVVSIIGDMSKLSGVFSKASAEVGNFGSSITSKVGPALSDIGKYALVTGTALGTGLVAAGVKSTMMFKDFESAVANAASVTGKTGEAFTQAKANISALSQELGQKTVFTTKQAADSLYYLASAGIDVSTMTSSQLVPMMNLASATQYDLAETTATTLSTLSEFGLGFESAGRLADVFAAACGQSQAKMEKLSLSMTYVGTTAKTVGMSLEETTATLGMLYNAGMDGSTAGTSLRGVLASLVSPTKAATETLAGMGVSVDKVNPVTNKFADIVQLLADKGLNANQAFQIFGRESAPAILALTSKTGDLKKLTEQLQAAGGTAQTMADEQLDTLSGSLDNLGGSIENIMINVGGALAPTIRSVAGSLNEMTPAIQDWLIAIIGAITGFVSKLSPAFDSIKTIGSVIIDVFQNIFQASFSNSNIGTGLADTISNIMSTIAGIVQKVTPIVQNGIITTIALFRNMVTWLSPTFENIKAILGDALNVFSSFFSGISGPVVFNVANSLAQGINFISGLLKSFADVISSALIAVAPTVKAIFGEIVNIMSGLADAVGPIWNQISNRFQMGIYVFEQFISSLSPLWQLIKNDFAMLVNTFRKFIPDISPIWDAISNKMKELPSILSNVVSGLGPVWTRIGSFLDAGLYQFKLFISNLGPTWTSIQSTFSQLPTIFNNAVSALTPVWNGLKSLFETGLTIIQSFVSNLGPTWDNLRSSFDSLITIISKVAPALAKFFESFGGTGASQAVNIGKALAEVVNILSGALAGLMRWLADNPKIVEFGLAVTGVAIAISTLAPIVASAVAVFWDVVGIIGMITAALESASILAIIGGISEAIVGFAATFLASITTIGSIAATIGAVIISPVGLIAIAVAALAIAWYRDWGGIQEKARAVWDFLATTANNLNTRLGDAYNAIIASGSLLQTRLGAAWNAIIASGQTLISMWGSLWSNFQSIITSAASSVSGAIAGLLSAIQSRFNSIIAAGQSLLASWRSHWTNVTSATNNAASTVSSALSNLLSRAQGIFNNIVSAAQILLNNWRTHWNNLVSATNSAASNVASALSSLLSRAQSAFNNIISAANSLLNQWRTVWNNIVSTVNSYAGTIASAVSGLASRISGLAGSFYSAGASIMNSLASGITSKIDSIKSSINGLLSWIDQHMPHSPAQAGPLSRLPNFTDYISTPLSKAVAAAKSTAQGAGTSIINTIASGVKSAASAVYNAASSALSKVASLLPHSPAKEGPFKTLPDWDSIFLTPMMKSISSVSKLSNPLSNALSNIRSPLNTSMAASLQRVSNTSNISNSYGGDTLNLGGVTISNEMDLQTIFLQFEKWTAERRRARGVYM